ncbi:MAG: hypothetical protein IPJ40_12065 [Saprospirales bacterium]|nr:hypothetical protein [Saprospirales bacterium]
MCPIITIAWLGTHGDDFKVYGYGMETGEITRITDNSFNDQGLKISGPNLVWMGNSHIFGTTLKTGMTAQLTQGAGTGKNPDISGNSVVWQGMDSEGDSEIFAHNLSTGVTIQVTDNALWDNFPKSPETTSCGMIFHSFTGATDVFYDMGTGEITQLPNETDSEFFCEVDGIPSYNRYTGTSYEIILYDIKTGLISQITDHDFGGSYFISPAITLFGRDPTAPTWRSLAISFVTPALRGKDRRPDRSRDRFVRKGADREWAL